LTRHAFQTSGFGRSPDRKPEDYQQLIQLGGPEVLASLYGLLMQVYELSFEDRHLSVQEAESYVPVGPVQTRRYLEIAKAARFLEIHRDPLDSGHDVIMPGPRLAQFATGDANPLSGSLPLRRVDD